MVKCAVIGCGAMGLRIAGELAYHGHRVAVWDRDASQMAAVHPNLNYEKQELLTSGLMEHEDFLGTVICLSRFEDAVSDADFIFEAVCEDISVKRSLFDSLTAHCRADSVLASNTISLNIDDICQNIGVGKDRILGLRFLFPVFAIPDVEVSHGQLTSTKVLERARVFLESMGKTMFYRSGHIPLRLSDQQIESRHIARKAQIRTHARYGGFEDTAFPVLSHAGNINPMREIVPTVRDRDCAICMDRPKNCLFSPCNHVCVCMECAKSLKNRKDYCPVCRQEIAEIIRVFM